MEGVVLKYEKGSFGRSGKWVERWLTCDGQRLFVYTVQTNAAPIACLTLFLGTEAQFQVMHPRVCVSFAEAEWGSARAWGWEWQSAAKGKAEECVLPA